MLAALSEPRNYDTNTTRARVRCVRGGAHDTSSEQANMPVPSRIHCAFVLFLPVRLHLKSVRYVMTALCNAEKRHCGVSLVTDCPHIQLRADFRPTHDGVLN